MDPPTSQEGHAVVAGLADWLESRPPTVVLVYLSMEGEIPAEHVVSRVDGHRFATTRTPKKGWLTIHPFEARRERHAFGYEQPVETSPTVPPDEVGVVLVPGLLFDRQGRRLGWGKGYYDEMLGRLPMAHRIGVTLERRLVDELPFEPHDARMHALAAESGVEAVFDGA